ncbi:hypothetical protein BWI93_04565 [Siphonobacter sp. BAB-5385]|uniref:hypothetical protein n=1 Tax=Siphonobacter sp. BAB-5385 TaxID=1864822 RepID=UPI000B9E671B|nr:hypothetical protein [Siphonobacter sp. BAB-5385]OZI09337.1 hypothetical protein BWI93_04565 [Siphonobacter sp. BAB-5385]
MAPSYANPFDSGKSINWLTEEQLHSIATDLLFETRLTAKLEYLYQEFGKANGLKMYDILIEGLIAHQNTFDSLLIRDGLEGEGDENGENIHWFTLDEKRQRTSFPIATMFPSHFGRVRVSHISWMDIQRVISGIEEFVRSKDGLEDPSKELNTLFSKALMQLLGMNNESEQDNSGETSKHILHSDKSQEEISFDINQEDELKGIIINKSRFLKFEAELLAKGYLDKQRKWLKNQITIVEMIATLKVEGFFTPNLKNPKIRTFMANRYKVSINDSYTKPSKLKPVEDKYARYKTNEFSHFIPKG